MVNKQETVARQRKNLGEKAVKGVARETWTKCGGSQAQYGKRQRCKRRWQGRCRTRHQQQCKTDVVREAGVGVG